MATAKRLPSGTYRCVVYIGNDENGKRKYKSITDPDKRRCEKLAAEYADKHRSFQHKDKLQTALREYIELRKPVLSPATVRGYENVRKALEKDYLDFLQQSVYDIDSRKYQQMVNAWTVIISPKTIRNRTGLISSVLKYKGVQPPILKLPDKVKPDLHIPDVADVKRIIDVAAGSEMEIPILLGAFAPMRRSEIVALTMDDIDGNTIHVHRAIVMNSDGENVGKGTKTYESDRFILMPQEIIKKIRDRGYVTKITNPQHISQRFEHIARRANCKGVRFHDLRHWCASYLHAQGVPEQYILERGGWTSDGVMKSVYRHSLSSESDSINGTIIQTMSSNFFG